MHIPIIRGRKGWQRFMLGLFTGFLIGYCMIMFMYGSMYEKLVENNLTLQAKVNELESLYESLLQDQKDDDQKMMTIESIEVLIMNTTELKFDRLIIHQLSEMIKKEINHVIGKDIAIISNSDQLLISTIENKTFTIGEFSYKFEIKKLTISRTVKLQLIGKISN